MSDVSRRRRIAGRLLLGAATLALPLTASVSYAQGEAMEEVELAPSAAATDESARQVNRQAQTRRLVAAESDAASSDRDPSARAAPRSNDEKQAISFRNDHPLTERQLQELREMGKRFEGRDWEEFAERQKEFAKRQEDYAKRQEDYAKRQEDYARRQEELAERMAVRMAAEAPIVETRCDEEETPIRNSIDADGRQRIAICERAIERQALRSAAVSLRQTRESIARNRALDAEVRNEILQDLDKEIERIERERRDS